MPHVTTWVIHWWLARQKWYGYPAWLRKSVLAGRRVGAKLPTTGGRKWHKKLPSLKMLRGRHRLWFSLHRRFWCLWANQTEGWTCLHWWNPIKSIWMWLRRQVILMWSSCCLPTFHVWRGDNYRQTSRWKIRHERLGSDEKMCFESDYSIVFDEAENRMHTIKAVMVATLGD